MRDGSENLAGVQVLVKQGAQVGQVVTQVERVNELFVRSNAGQSLAALVEDFVAVWIRGPDADSARQLELV